MSILVSFGLVAILALCGCGDGANSDAGDLVPAPLDEVPSIPPDLPAPPPSGCADSFDSTFEAIQEVIFEDSGCTQELCHGSARAGGLDLRSAAAFESLVGVPSTGSTLLRVESGSVQQSYLFHKIAAKTSPEKQAIPISGSAMPVGDRTVPGEHLEALRLWIEGAAPEFGVLGDEFGGTRIADLLGTCLPPPSPIEVTPLPAPAPDEGIQFEMPPHEITAGSEVEVCFAVYHDFRDQIPEQFMSADREVFYTWRDERREDPNTHHNIVGHSGFYEDSVNDPSFGRWHCVEGPRHDEDCDPLAPAACGDGGFCISNIAEATACFGFGPPGSTFRRGRIPRTGGTPGVFNEEKTYGIFYYNSHAYNLTPKDLKHHLWLNLYFTDDLRFRVTGIGGAGNIFAPNAAPFTKEEYCFEHVFEQGTELLTLSSHMHKRGERFTIHRKSTRQSLYHNPYWEDPLVTIFDPPMRFDSPDVEERTLTYCALYNNGVRPDGSPDTDLVTRNSRKARGSCEPIACAEGRIGAPCNGANDNAACDTSPGAGDGFCDACRIAGGVTSDDEMLIISGSKLVAIDSP